MIEGRLGNLIIAQAPYQQIAATNFQETRNTTQNMEQSKIQFGVFDPIDLVKVKLTPPLFRGNQSKGGDLTQDFQRSFNEDLQVLNMISITELNKIKEKSNLTKLKYLPQSAQNQQYQQAEEEKVRIKMANSVLGPSEEDNDVEHSCSTANTVYTSTQSRDHQGFSQ